MDKPLTRLRKREKRHKLQISKINKGTSLQIHRHKKNNKHCDQLYANKLDNPNEMDQIFERHNLQNS